jgi:hypothetical protein
MTRLSDYPRYYRLEGHTPVVCRDVVEWGQWVESNDRIVEQTHVGRVFVSTIFLGIDLSFGDGYPPLLFETRVFGGWEDGQQVRTSTWETAVAVHTQVVALVRLTRWWPVWFKKVSRWWAASWISRPAREVIQINVKEGL